MKTNNLNSHHPERKSHRVDKMSGMEPGERELSKGSSKKFMKKFTNKKRRSFLNNITDKL